MKVKKFLASNNQEAMLKIKTELGSDAVILHQRKVKPKGFFGLFKKSIVEIVAAKEDYYNENSTEKNIQQLPENKLKSQVELKVIKGEEKNFSKEIFEIKSMLHTVLAGINSKPVDGVDTALSKDLNDFKSYLIAQEIETGLLSKIIVELVDIIKEHSQDEVEKEIIYREFQKVIQNYITDQGQGTISNVVFFVGPTGVGKTTTIAKLAANFSLNEGKTVGLISADTYRIAAVEQLKTYCNILNIPMEIIYESSEVNEAINRLKEKDIILVDTAGRSHKNENQIKELAQLLNEVEEKEIYLVVSCTTKDKDLKEIIKAYEFIDNYKIIFTKLDEATTVGSILNVAYETKRPISYITTGQSVPDDIEILDVHKVAELLLKEVQQ